MIIVGTSFHTPKYYGFYIRYCHKADLAEKQGIWEALKAHVLGYR